MLTPISPEQRANISNAGRRLTDIITTGKRTPGMNPSCRPCNIPEWFERETFQHAQELFSVYGMIIGLAHYYGLMLGLNQMEGLLPLLTTGNSTSVSKQFTRYLSTLLHLNCWFKSDPFDPSSEAYKSIKIVRGLHYQVYEKLNNREAAGRGVGVDKLWMSQYAMCGAQFSFMGLIAIFPKELGFHNFTRKDFHAYFHFWRTIGHCLGIEDRFNLCSGSDDEIIELCKLIYNGAFMLNIRDKREPTGIRMCQTVCLGMEKLNPLLNYNVLMRYYAPCLRMDPKEYPLESFSEWFHYRMLKFILGTVCQYKWANWMLSKMASIAVRCRQWTLSGLEGKLEKKYGDVAKFGADQRCPFDIKLNYKAKF